MRDGLLEFKDAPMFGRIMRDKEICKEALQRILGIEIADIEYLNVEQSLDPVLDAKGVRLDVFAKGSGKVYDIEMQRTNRLSLGKRMRYYQASMDVDCLAPGEDYEVLPESYVIFICEDDPYECGFPMYHLERSCNEDNSVEVADSSHWLILNASAWEKEPDKGRQNLLRYIYESSHTATNDALLSRIHEAVTKANQDRSWRGKAVGFLTLESDYRAQKRAARRIGHGEGILLASKLIEDGREADVDRAAKDEDYFAVLCEEYGIVLPSYEQQNQ